MYNNHAEKNHKGEFVKSAVKPLALAVGSVKAGADPASVMI